MATTKTTRDRLIRTAAIVIRTALILNRVFHRCRPHRRAFSVARPGSTCQRALRLQYRFRTAFGHRRHASRNPGRHHHGRPHRASPSPPLRKSSPAPARATHSSSPMHSVCAPSGWCLPRPSTPRHPRHAPRTLFPRSRLWLLRFPVLLRRMDLRPDGLRPQPHLRCRRRHA